MIKQIIEEIENYRSGDYEMEEGYSFSAWKLLRRIGLYKAQIYPTGKFDSQGNYKYWFDIITPRVNSEVKNVDFDTKDILLYSDAKNDSMRLLFANVRMKDYLAESGESEKLNEAVEQGSEWGNLVWKKTTDGYRILELPNIMVLNQKAKTLEESDEIEYECMLPSDLRKKADIWQNVEDLIKSGTKKYKKSNPEFFVYERNGEVNEKDFNDARAQMLREKSTEGKEDEYFLAKVIVGGTEKDKPTHILYCDKIDERPYKEFHRSSFKGRWLRVGMYETLMDIQTRANEIGNQIARGLEWASKTIFASADRLIAQNILTDLQNGDIIKAKDLKQVEVRMQGLDQLIADWNRLMQHADALANSFEVVTGESSPSGTPFRLAAQQNMNANKLFDFIREKLGIAFQSVIEDWILPNLLKDLNTKEILRLTADTGVLNRYYEALVDDWYSNNLLSFPPHDESMATDLKMQKMQELMKNKEAVVELEKEMWKGFRPRVRVSITGENYNLAAELDTYNSFIQLEQDPVRRTALIEMAMAKKGIDVASLPKTPPQPPVAPQGAPQQDSGGLDSAISRQEQMMAG
jgi:hypothetical protein